MQPSYIKKPLQFIQTNLVKANIFSKDHQEQEPGRNIFAKQQANSYHYIGSSQLRQKIIVERQKQSQSRLSKITEKQSLTNISITKQMVSSVKRQTNQSKISSIRKQCNRDLKSLNHYKEYQDIWKKQSQRIRNNIQRHNTPTLLETNIKKLQVIPNPQKEEVLIKYLNNYWEMSLRNNSKVLTSFMKGDSRYDNIQLAKKLNLGQDQKQLEKSLPKLPLQKLQNVNHQQFKISGRNKLGNQSGTSDPSILSSYSNHLSKASINKFSKQDVYKINYDIAHGYIHPNYKEEQ